MFLKYGQLEFQILKVIGDEAEDLDWSIFFNSKKELFIWIEWK